MLMSRNDDDGSSDSDSDVAFASMDFAGVDFDNGNAGLSQSEMQALAVEQRVLFSDYQDDVAENDACSKGIRELYGLLSNGQYREALLSAVTEDFIRDIDHTCETARMAELIRDRVYSYCVDVPSCVEVELLAVAAFNMFLQLNYTGPLLDRSTSPTDDTPLEPLAGVNPHECFQRFTESVKDEETKEVPLTAPTRDNTFYNVVLSELAVDGEWPCQVCQAPYLLLLARSMFHALANPQRNDWTHSAGSDESETSPEAVPPALSEATSNLKTIHLWNARAAVAHSRLLQTRDSSVTLWNETKESFKCALGHFCETVDTSSNDVDNWDERSRAATVVLEWGLAHHYFNRPDQGKLYFHKAMEYSGLQVEVTGAVGKRTKFQQESKAQMVVRATSANDGAGFDGMTDQSDKMKAIEHGEDGILLEKIKFDDEKENQVSRLSTLDQAILLSLCLDVKNNNPADGLTGEQMGAYLARVLEQHDDWMVYSTALLERAWLECERTQGRERAILQIQALVDQHSNRLTVTQSTFESVEESAPPQDRLRNLHSIVYPPRWAMLRDLAERYAKLGVVTTAAEMFEEIEQWDEVVECYRHAGKLSQAEQIVCESLAKAETPRMWAALGDLTKDPSHYHKALELSNGRYSDAYVALGKYHFDKGESEQAADYYTKALKIRPLMPSVWFRLGTISMQLGRWKEALNAFSEVVQQEPEEADAWANVAAVHMHNLMPAEAFPALTEVRRVCSGDSDLIAPFPHSCSHSSLVQSLKYNRNNWRVWTSKLYTCIDLQKYDEAVQACNVLLDLKATKNLGENIPPLEEKCVRAIVGGSIESYRKSQTDAVAKDSARRTLTRVHDLLERLSSCSTTEAWIWDTLAYFNAQIGRDEAVLENLMKEYRSLQSARGWEKDPPQVKKVSQVVKHIVQFQIEDGSKECLAKSKLLLSGVVRKIRAVHLDESDFPEEVADLLQLQEEVEACLQALN